MRWYRWSAGWKVDDAYAWCLDLSSPLSLIWTSSSLAQWEISKKVVGEGQLGLLQDVKKPLARLSNVTMNTSKFLGDCEEGEVCKICWASVHIYKVKEGRGGTTSDVKKLKSKNLIRRFGLRPSSVTVQNRKMLLKYSSSVNDYIVWKDTKGMCWLMYDSYKLNAL